MLELKIRCTQTAPLLMHNATALANPHSVEARAVKELAGLRRRSEEQDRQLLVLEAWAGTYRDGRDVIVVPTANLLAALRRSATLERLGEAVRRGLTPQTISAPVLLDGAELKARDWVADLDPDRVLVTTVVVQRQRVVRARAMLPIGAQHEHRVLLDEEVLNVETLERIAERAGRLIGLGDWRPLYGRADIEVAL